MASLRNRHTQQLAYLRAVHVFGRNPDKADTVLGNLDASQIHASIRWNGAAWTLIDHSRNGSYIEGRKIGEQGQAELRVGQTIQFALGDAAGWEVADLEPPCAMLLPPHSGLQALALQGFHLLPNESAPESTLSLSPGGQWVWEQGDCATILEHGARVRIGGETWTFASLGESEPTAELAPLDGQRRAPVLNFNVSQNEEHISLTIAEAERTADLGERTHHYSLLTLARLRLDDAARGTEAASQGWVEVDRLARMLGLDGPHLNIQIFRVRNQIARAFPEGSPSLANVIERRRGEVRFGAFGFQIMRGSRMEGSFIPELTTSAPMAPAQC